MHELSKDFAKHEAKGRAEMERTIKPKMKGLAEGGPVRKMYADDNDGVVSQDDQAPPYLRQPSPSEDKSSLDKLIDMKHAESMPSAPEEDHSTAFEETFLRLNKHGLTGLSRCRQECSRKSCQVTGCSLPKIYRL